MSNRHNTNNPFGHRSHRSSRLDRIRAAQSSVKRNRRRDLRKSNARIEEKAIKRNLLSEFNAVASNRQSRNNSRRSALAKARARKAARDRQKRRGQPIRGSLAGVPGQQEIAAHNRREAARKAREKRDKKRKKASARRRRRPTQQIRAQMPRETRLQLERNLARRVAAQPLTLARCKIRLKKANLQNMTVAELRRLATVEKIKGRSKMKKAQLVNALAR